MELTPKHILEADRDTLLAEQNLLLNRLQFIEKRLDRVMGHLALHEPPQPAVELPAQRPELRVIQGGLA